VTRRRRDQVTRTKPHAGQAESDVDLREAGAGLTAVLTQAGEGGRGVAAELEEVVLIR